MSSPTLRSDRYPQIKAAVISAFVGGETLTQRALAEIIAGQHGLDADAIARHLTPFLRRLEARSHYVAQRAPCGSKGDGMTTAHLTSPLIFTWAPVSIDDATLCDAVAPYFAAADDEVSPSAKKDLRAALRFAEELPTQCDDATILAACARVPARRLHGYADRVLAAAVAPPAQVSGKTGANHRSALRRMLRWALEHDLVPMGFPEYWPVDAWSDARDRYFPLAVEGRTNDTVHVLRTAWTAYGATCRTLFGDEVLPEAVTREQAECAITHLQHREGQIAVAYNARRALRDIASRLGVGPFMGGRPDAEFLVATPRGPRPALYIYGLDGQAGDGDWAALLGILRARGLPADLIEFLVWYERWVTLDTMAILRQPLAYPPRRESVRLDPTTLEARILALRALIGCAINICGLAPATLTPAVIFGTKFGELVAAMVDWWDRRRAVLPAGANGSGQAGALRQHVIGVGQVALALYERMRHGTGERAKTIVSTNAESREQHERLDWREEEAVGKSEAQRAVWNAYRLASHYADALVGQARGVTGKRGAQRPNEYKDLQKIIETTPPTYWIEMLDSLIEEVRGAKRAGRDHGYTYHKLVLDTFTLGAYVSTGCRNAELLHVRLDVQFTEEDRRHRRIRVRAIDRKNRKEHTVLLQPSFVPDDLLEEYLGRTRPFFMHDNQVARGRVAIEHAFLLVSTSGRAYGCIEERIDGKGRDKRAFRRRSRQHSQRFKTALSRIAVRLGLPLPGRKHEFGLHAVRGSCAYAVYHQLGLVAAADYLGDSLKTVERAYSKKSGLHVDSSCLRGLDMRPKLTILGDVARSTGRPGNGLADRLAALVRDYEGREDSFDLARAVRDTLGASDVAA